MLTLACTAIASTSCSTRIVDFPGIETRDARSDQRSDAADGAPATPSEDVASPNVNDRAESPADSGGVDSEADVTACDAAVDGADASPEPRDGRAIVDVDKQDVSVDGRDGASDGKRPGDVLAPDLSVPPTASRYVQYTCCKSGSGDGCVKETAGGPTSCKTIGDWKYYSYTVCAQMGLSLYDYYPYESC